MWIRKELQLLNPSQCSSITVDKDNQALLFQMPGMSAIRWKFKNLGQMQAAFNAIVHHVRDPAPDGQPWTWDFSEAGNPNI